MHPEMQQLIDYVKQVSPFLWSVAYREVWVDVGTCIVIGFLLFGGAAYCRKLSRGKHEEERFFSIAGVVVGTLVGIGLLISAAYMAANPGYTAVQELFQLMPRR